MEDFVSFNLAEYLKDKGFDYNTDWYYDFKGGITWGIPQGTSVLDECDYTARPTISQVLKWLRDEKKLYISIHAVTEGVYWWNINELCNHISYDSDTEHSTYESAAIDGIEYCLDNLI